MDNQQIKTNRSIKSLAPELFLAVGSVGLMSFIIESVLPGVVARVLPLNLVWLLVAITAVPLFFIPTGSLTKQTRWSTLILVSIAVTVFIISPIGMLGSVILALVVSFIGLSLLRNTPTDV